MYPLSSGSSNTSLHSALSYNQGRSNSSPVAPSNSPNSEPTSAWIQRREASDFSLDPSASSEMQGASSMSTQRVLAEVAARLQGRSLEPLKDGTPAKSLPKMNITPNR